MANPDLYVDPALAWADDAGRPLGLVALDRCPSDLAITRLPAFPLIGVGDPAHPAAMLLDTVVETPVRLDTLVTAITARPGAAAVAADLLRSIDGLPPDRALPLESLAYGALQAGAAHREWLRTRPPAPCAAAGRLLSRRTAAGLSVAIDRPAARNAVDRALRDALRALFDAAAVDGTDTTIALRAVGRAFGIGGDLAEFGHSDDPVAAHAIRMRTLPALAVARCARRLDVHVRGACAGASLEIAAFAARLTASVDAWFQLPELSMGLIPGAGGCVSVPRRIGRHRALLMILSGRRISARTALGWGLIDSIVDEPPVDPDRDGFDVF